MEHNSQLNSTGLSGVVIDVARQLCETECCETTRADFPENKESTTSFFLFFFVSSGYGLRTSVVF